MKEQTYSTAQVANIIGVSKRTLLRWLIGGEIAEPKRVEIGGQEVRVWKEKDIARVRKYQQERSRKYGALKRLVIARTASKTTHKRTAQNMKNLTAMGPVLSDKLGPKFLNLAVGDELLTPEQLAERLQVDPSWVYDQTRKRAKVRGKPPIPRIKMGKYLRFSWPDVVKWLDDLGKSSQ